MLRILFLIISCSCIIVQGTANKDEQMDVFRLPNNTEPISYKLYIQPLIDTQSNSFTFIGDITIRILVKTSTRELTLNAVDLYITKIEIKNTDSLININVTDSFFVEKNEQLKIHLVEPGLIADQTYEVRIIYSGKLRDDMVGFYRSSYVDEDNNTKWIVVTQFEATYARTAFPCYDEPAFKTPFDIFIIRKDYEMSLSNMALGGKPYQITYAPQPNVNYICDPYQTTDPIPTYLVAFSVSEFKNTSVNQKIHVYTHKDYLDQVTYIEEKANKLLSMMEIYTNIPYPYPKIDLLAVPDFSSGAMENWGLNTYREKYLLVGEKSSKKDIEEVVTTVQHELSHQWFGDLVTCAWWDYLWLNEAFATLFEYFAVQVAEPSWRVGDMFIVEHHQEALNYDQLPAHPITATVKSPDDIRSIFDTITYSKGASVLRMLKFALNDEIFRDSLSSYLKKYRYKSVEPQHLWKTFDTVLFEADYKLGILGDTVTVEEFMNSWTDQSGYPVINVDTSNDPNSYIITQKRFQVDESDLDNTALWYVGLSYTTENNPKFNNPAPSFWIKNTETKVTFRRTENSGWVIFNLQSSGFYRVNYDSKNWDLLISQLMKNPKAIHVLNRAQLIDDSFNLARAGDLSYFVPLNLVSYLDTEDDFMPWYSVRNSLSYVVKRMRRCSHTGSQIREFTKKYAEIAYQKVSFLYEKNDGKHFTNTSMNAFSNWACELEVESCVQSALNYFNSWQQNGTVIPPDIKEAVFCVGVKNGTEATWNNVFNVFLNTSSSSERKAALLALACSTNSTILSNYLNLLLGDNCPIRTQDYQTVFYSLVSTPVGINVTTAFLQNKLNETISHMWKGEETAAEIYEYLTMSVATTKEIDEINVIRNFDYLSPRLKKSFDKSYKRVKFHSSYFERSHPILHKWFQSTQQSTTPAPSSAVSNSYTYIYVIVLSFLSLILLSNNL